MATPMTRPTPTERMHNHIFRFNGTASAGINPSRRAILSILQTVRPTTGADDYALHMHFYSRMARGYKP